MPKLKEILERIQNSGYEIDPQKGKPYLKRINNIDQALSEIKSLIKEKLPKKKETDYTRDEGIFKWETQLENNGFDICLTEIERRVENL